MKKTENSFIKEESGNVRLNIYLQPRSSKNEIVGIFEDCIKIKITAPPVDNEANTQLINFLSKILKIKKQNISIVHGFKGRKKVIQIKGIALNLAMKMLTLTG